MHNQNTALLDGENTRIWGAANPLPSKSLAIDPRGFAAVTGSRTESVAGDAVHGAIPEAAFCLGCRPSLTTRARELSLAPAPSTSWPPTLLQLARQSVAVIVLLGHPDQRPHPGMDAAHEPVDSNWKISQKLLRTRRHVDRARARQTLRRGGQANVERRNTASAERRDPSESMKPAARVRDANGFVLFHREIRGLVPPRRMPNHRQR